MTFAANPLSLSVPEPAFEAWLRDAGYHEILDDRTAAASPSSLPLSPADLLCNRNATAAATSTTTFFAFSFSFLRTLLSLLTVKPFAKLSPDDFSGRTPSWTFEFIGAAESFSWPAGPHQARMRVQENVRRYARNYAFLTFLFFACFLYLMSASLLGLIASLGLWELARFCSDRWELELRSSGLRQALVRIAQFATGVVLYLCNLQLVVIWTISVSYSVMIMHASLRKLSPPNQYVGANYRKRFEQKRHN